MCIVFGFCGKELNFLLVAGPSITGKPEECAEIYIRTCSNRITSVRQALKEIEVYSGRSREAGATDSKAFYRSFIKLDFYCVTSRLLVIN